MTTQEKVDMCKALYGETILDNSGQDITNTTFEQYLQLAERKALGKLYPFGAGDETLPIKYETDVCELAVRLVARRGGEGEIQHSENGVARIYKDVSDEDILARFVPFGKVC